MKYRVKLYLLNNNTPEPIEVFYCDTEDRQMQYTYTALNYYKDSTPVCLIYEWVGNTYTCRGRMYYNKEE